MPQGPKKRQVFLPGGRSFRCQPFQVSRQFVGLITKESCPVGTVLLADLEGVEFSLRVVENLPGPSEKAHRVQCLIEPNEHANLFNSNQKELQACRFPVAATHLQIAPFWEKHKRADFLLADASLSGARVWALNDHVHFNPNNVVIIFLPSEDGQEEWCGRGKIIRWSDPQKYRSKIYWKGYGLDILDWSKGGQEIWRKFVDNQESRLVRDLQANLIA